MVAAVTDEEFRLRARGGAEAEACRTAELSEFFSISPKVALEGAVECEHTDSMCVIVRNKQLREEKRKEMRRVSV